MPLQPETPPLVHAPESPAPRPPTPVPTIRARPAMPTGTVRARRTHPRYRKGKVRADASLEPAAPPMQDSKLPNHNKLVRTPKPHKLSVPRLPTVISEDKHQQIVQQIVQQQAQLPAQILPVTPHQTLSTSEKQQQVVQPHSLPHHMLGKSLPQDIVSLDAPNVQENHVKSPHNTSHPQKAQMTPEGHSKHLAPEPKTPISNVSPAHGQDIRPGSSSPRLIVDFSPQSQQSSSITNRSEPKISVQDAAASDTTGTAGKQGHEASILKNDEEIAHLATRIRAPSEAGRPRPLICQDITNSNADTLRISRLPRGVTYDRLLSMVEPFGEVEDLSWTASDPYVCDVTYRDPSAAREAKHFLGDALVGNDSEPPLKAELRSRDPGAQLFIGDLTPDVTEEMLEEHFSKLVDEPVSALLKRDPESFSTIGYGFLSFSTESSANFALVAGHRAKIGNASVRVGRAERNTHVYVSDLAPEVTLDDVKGLFGKFGSLVEEDTVIIRRSYAFIRYKNRGAAEKAKRTLDKTDLKGRLSVRYAEAEPLKACVAVQFHSSVPRPPNSLRDLLSATFSKHGNCSVEIPRLRNGMWRKVAFVTFHGEPIAANLAALEAVQSIRFVSSLPVCCQFARELIPRLPSRGMQFERLADSSRGPHIIIPHERTSGKPSFLKKSNARSGGESSHPRNSSNISGLQAFEHHGATYIGEQETQPAGHDYVPVYVPIAALQHPGQIAGSVGQSAEFDYNGYQQHWQHRTLLPNGTSVAQNLNPGASQFSPSYNSFPSVPERAMRW